MNSLESKHDDIIKVFATFLVVFAHVSRMYTGLGVVTPHYTSVGLENYIHSTCPSTCVLQEWFMDCAFLI